METIRRSRAVWMLAALLAAVVAITLIWEDPAEARKKKRRWVDQIVFASDRTTGTGVNNPEGDLEIFSIRPDGTGLRQLTVNSVLDDGPVMSRNGAKIAYSSQEHSPDVPNADGDREIVVMNRDGSNKTNLTNNTSIPDSTPDFSPDGSTIAYTQVQVDPEIFTVKADNTEGQRQFRFSPGSPEFRPVFSPDGQRIAFTGKFASAPNDDFEILDVPVSDGNAVPRNLTDNGTQDFRPEYSPDGSKIYYDSVGKSSINAGGEFDVMVTTLDGFRTTTNLTEDPAADATDDLRPSVRRSGTRIVYEKLSSFRSPDNATFSPTNQPGGLFIMDANGGANKRPIPNIDSSKTNQSPDWGGYWRRR